MIAIYYPEKNNPNVLNFRAVGTSFGYILAKNALESNGYTFAHETTKHKHSLVKFRAVAESTKAAAEVEAPKTSAVAQAELAIIPEPSNE